LGNEDCLYLDIYVPKTASPDKLLPVMVWMYGGGYKIGDKYEFGFYDGENLAKDHDVIVVGMNYRLEGLGFIALEELAKEDPDFSTG